MHRCPRFARRIRTISHPCFLLLTSVLLLSGVGRADEFTLKSGNVVSGAVVSQTDSEYVLQTEVGTIKISKSDVLRTVSLGTTPEEIQVILRRAKVTMRRQEPALPRPCKMRKVVVSNPDGFKANSINLIQQRSRLLRAI